METPGGGKDISATCYSGSPCGISYFRIDELAKILDVALEEEVKLKWRDVGLEERVPGNLISPSLVLVPVNLQQ